MNIQTVRDNLKNTIVGKEMMLSTLQQRVHIERTVIDQTAFIAVINYLQVNLAELRGILKDVEQSIEKE